jgi:hypothetical protein
MPILTETFEGAPGGMNLALPQQELDDTEARYIQDGLVDFPGLTRRRGPVRKVTGLANLTRPGTGLALALNPLGIAKVGALNGDSANGYFSVLSDDLTSVVSDLAWPHPLPTTPSGSTNATSYRIVDIKPALNGGALIGVSSAYDSNSPNQGLAYWIGANKGNYSGTIKVARGSAAVTLPSGANANIAPGHWVFADTDEGYSQTLIGYVKTVNSDTSVTLNAVSPYNVGQSPAVFKTATFQALRGLQPKVVTGTITVDTTSAQVTGGKTKFLSQHLNVGTWQLYKASDMSFVGKVASVQSEIALTLSANAAVAMAGENYIALRADGDYSIASTSSTQKVGFITATYAGRQHYFNNGAQLEKTYRWWFSDESDPEALDLSDFDGDWDSISSSSTAQEPVHGAVPTNTGLVVAKESETFIITGNSPNSFTPKKLEDDGALSGMSMQPYGGGVIWAGREGIHFFDGIQTENLIAAKLGEYWKQSIRSFDPYVYRMWSMIEHDHYKLFIERITPTVAVVKGTTSVTPTKLTVVINMVSRAVTFETNVNIRGAVTLPAGQGRSVWYLVNGQVAGDSEDHAFVADGEALFAEEGVDPITCDSGTRGPDFYFESKKFDAGDSTRLKKFKQLMLHYLVQGGDITVDTVIGLNNIGKVLTGNFPASVMSWDNLRAAVTSWDGVKAQYATWSALIQGVFKPKRVKFQKGSQHLSFRLYQSNANITRLQIGPYHVGYKLKRLGRV